MSAMLEEAIEEVRALPAEELEELRDLTANLGELLIIAIIFAFVSKQGKSGPGELRSLLEKVNSGTPTDKPFPALRARRSRAELRQLAEEQGVKPFDFDHARANFWPEEESADDFLVWLRSMR